MKSKSMLIWPVKKGAEEWEKGKEEGEGKVRVGTVDKEGLRIKRN